MAIKLENKTNVQAPDSDYPFGQIKDNTGAGNGTPVSRNVYGDFHQFFAKLMDLGGVVHNGLEDNEYSGFQLIEALLKTFPDTLQFIIDGGGTVITTGIKGELVVPYNCRVIGWVILSRTAGSIVVDVSSSTYADFDTMVSIMGSEKPTLSTAKKNRNLALAVPVELGLGDIVDFEVESVTSVDRVTVNLIVEKIYS